MNMSPSSVYSSSVYSDDGSVTSFTSTRAIHTTSPEMNRSNADIQVNPEIPPRNPARLIRSNVISTCRQSYSEDISAELKQAKKQINELTKARIAYEVERENLWKSHIDSSTEMEELKHRLENRCERKGCRNLVCTNVSNDKNNTMQTPAATGRSGVEQNQLLNSISKHRLLAPGEKSQRERPIIGPRMSSLSLGEPMLPSPAPLTILEDMKQATVQKATPTSLGYFQQPASDEPRARFSDQRVPDTVSSAVTSLPNCFQEPEYRHIVTRELRHTLRLQQKSANAVRLKYSIESLSERLVTEKSFEMLMNENSTTATSAGGSFEAGKVQEARERYDKYAPRWHEEDELMNPILRLAGLPSAGYPTLDMTGLPPAIAPGLEEEGFSLPEPAMPIPISLIVEELIHRVEADGKMLYAVKEVRKRDGNIMDQVREEIDVLSIELQKVQDEARYLRAENVDLKQKLRKPQERRGYDLPVEENNVLSAELQKVQAEARCLRAENMGLKQKLWKPEEGPGYGLPMVAKKGPRKAIFHEELD